MESNVIIRELLPEEYGFMEEIMYDVIYQPDKENLIPREVIGGAVLFPFMVHA